MKYNVGTLIKKATQPRYESVDVPDEVPFPDNPLQPQDQVRIESVGVDAPERTTSYLLLTYLLCAEVVLPLLYLSRQASTKDMK